MFGGLIDGWLILYMLITGGLTEAVARVFKKNDIKSRWGSLICLVLGLLVGLTGSLIQQSLVLSTAIWRGVIVAAFTGMSYDFLKDAYLGILKGRAK